MLAPVGPTDTAATIAARYTLGGPAYADALIAHNTLPADLIGPNTNLAAFGILNLVIPTEWLRAGAQGASAPDMNEPKTGLQTPILGAPAWVWGAGALLILIGMR